MYRRKRNVLGMVPYNGVKNNTNKKLNPESFISKSVRIMTADVILKLCLELVEDMSTWRAVREECRR